MAKNRYYKSTQGFPVKALISNAVAYAADATFKAFVEASDNEGEVGVFITYDASGPTTYNEQTAVIYSSALATGDEFFVAQKIDGRIKKTGIIKFDDSLIETRAYVAPVKQITHIGYTGSTGNFNFPTIAAGQIYGFTVLETTPGYQPLPTWNVETISVASSTKYTILSALTKQINFPNVLIPNNQEDPLVRAEIISDGTTAEFDDDPTVTYNSATITFANDDTTYGGGATALVAGDYLNIRGDVYLVTAVSTGTVTIDRPYSGSTETIDVSATTNLALRVAPTPTNWGIRLTSLSFGTHFKVAVKESFEDAIVTYSTAFKQSIGAGSDIVLLEEESQVFEGYTTLNAAFAADYGKPTSYASLSLNYDQYVINTVKRRKSVGAPVKEDIERIIIIIAAPNSGTTPNSTLATIF